MDAAAALARTLLHRRRMRPADDPAWEQYPETVLELFRDPADDEPALRLDLRRPLGDADRQALAALGLDGPFGVVTAAAPTGEPQDDAFDRVRQAELEDVARTEALAETWRVDGVSPDGRHRERSVAVRLPRDRVVALGRHYRQSAVFWYDGRDVWLLGAVVDAAPERLPRARDRAAG